MRDLEALKEAAEACGLEFREGQRTYAWWGVFVGDTKPPAWMDKKDFGKSLHAIGRPGLAARNGGSGEFEIGVVAAPSGDGFELVLDEFGPGRRLTEAAGQGYNRLRQEYAVAVTRRRVEKTLGREGFRMERETVGARVRLRLKRR